MIDPALIREDPNRVRKHLVNRRFPADALEMFISSLPEGAFYGRGKAGPLVIMTDNCSELRDALRAIWPNVILLLCVFHMMQQFWRWIFEKNGIFLF